MFSLVCPYGKKKLCARHEHLVSIASIVLSAHCPAHKNITFHTGKYGNCKNVESGSVCITKTYFTSAQFVYKCFKSVTGSVSSRILSLKIPGVQKLRAQPTFGIGFTWNAHFGFSYIQ